EFMRHDQLILVMAIHSNTSKCKVFVVFFEKPLHLISPKIGLFLSISTFLCFSANPNYSSSH
ncbi:hypothetical protein, partial [Caldalkalibacillus thermarum]|uniref:hypothetical protein n=1 Tax=Caldalkalibacillus thermarum TaxID=296745 RepID=UPI001E5AA243